VNGTGSETPGTWMACQVPGVLSSGFTTPTSCRAAPTNMRYDRVRQSLDRHAPYIVATFVAGNSR